MGEVAQRVTRRNLNNECSRVLTASAEAGLIDQQEYFQKRIASHDLSHYYLLKRGDFAYNHSSSGSAALGIIKRLEAYDFGCLSTLYIIFHPKHGIDSDYLLHYFESSAWHGDVAGMVTEGARNHGLLNISPDTFFTARCSFPSLPEQRRIGKFFTIFDSLIAAAERQETLLRQKKQAYLQLMFPQEGETEPRLRFSGFIQNWRMHRMSEMVAPLNSIQQIMPDRDIEYRLWSVPSFQLGVPENVRGSRIMSSKLVLERDDILLSKINPRIQRIWRVDSDGTLPDVGSTEWVVFRAKPSKASPLFLKALLSSPLFYRYMVSTEKGATGSQKRADKTLLMSSCYWLPSLSEQQRIGAFFHLVDATLLTVQRNLAGLKELKRAYLQRMFI